MNKRYKHIIFFDTEFICSKRKNQPIEVSLIAYDVEKNNFVYDRSFSTYILLEKGIHLNKYVTEFTGIDEKILDKYGIRMKDARFQFLNFLLNYSPKDTLLAGWSIRNDITMLDIMVNKDEKIFDMFTFDWYDVSIVFKNYFKFPNNETPSLVNACQMIERLDFDFHNSYDDARATKEIMTYLTQKYGLGKLFDRRFIIDHLPVKKKKERVSKQKVVSK